MIQLRKWNFKVTFLDQPWALARKYLRLAEVEDEDRGGGVVVVVVVVTVTLMR